MTKAVLVTGGAGYIGSHACKALARAGYLPGVFDDLSAGHEHAVKWGPLELGNLLDMAALDRVITRNDPVAVIHFAGCAIVGESVENPTKYYRNNVAGTLNLLNAMRRANIGKIVFSSSCTVYGDSGETRLDETHPLAPINPYGRTKLVAERMIADFAAAYGMSYMSLRYFNAAGADPDGEIGEDHDPEPHLLPRLIGAALGHEPEVRIFGTDYPTPDGTCVRDYVHVTDLAEAHIRALKRLDGDDAPTAVNLGAGRGVSVRQVIDAVSCIAGSPLPVRDASRRLGDPAYLVADIGLAKSELAWSPDLSSLTQIVRTAWSWHRNAGTEKTPNFG